MRSIKGCKLLIVFAIIVCVFLFDANIVLGAEIPIPSVDINISAAETPEQVSRSLQILFLLTIISLAPFLLIMLTSFTRIIITLHFLRAAMGTQQMPPNQVLIGLALFLTLFIMGPTFTTINETVIQPYSAGEMTQEQALDEGMRPIRAFMFRQARIKDIEMFSGLAGLTPYPNYETMVEELPNSVLIPAFLVGELTAGFKLGFLMYIPFIVIDMVVASILMAMGMMMLPPAMMSLPFKILFFVLIDGWKILLENIVLTFY